MIQESTMNSVLGYAIAIIASLFVLYVVAAMNQMLNRISAILVVHVPAIMTALMIAYETTGSFMYVPAVIFSLYCLFLWTVEPGYYDTSDGTVNPDTLVGGVAFAPYFFLRPRFFLGLVNAAFVFMLYANLFPTFWRWLVIEGA